MEFYLFDDSDVAILEEASCNMKTDSGNKGDVLSCLLKGTLSDENMERLKTKDIPVHDSEEVKAEFLGESIESGSSRRPGRVQSPGLETEFRRSVSVSGSQHSGNGDDEPVPGSSYESAEVASRQYEGRNPIEAKKSVPRSSSPDVEFPRGESSHPFPPPKRGVRVQPVKEVRKIRVCVASMITSAVESACSASRKDEDGNFFKNGECGFVAHDFLHEVTDIHEHDPSEPSLSSKVDFVMVVELARTSVKRTLPFAKSVSFIMVAMKEEGWTVPPMFIFHSAINSLKSFIMESRPHLKSTLSWVDEWRNAGLISLHTEKIEDLEKWRGMIVQLNFPGFKLDTFPKDCLPVGSEILILLRTKYRHYKLKCLPFSLLNRNKGLHGKVRVTCSKTYGSADVTFLGDSKKDWRLVYLCGNSIFMDSLKAFSSNHPFNLGSGRVQIWGGVRKPMLPCVDRHKLKKTKFQWNMTDMSSLSPEIENGNVKMLESLNAQASQISIQEEEASGSTKKTSTKGKGKGKKSGDGMAKKTFAKKLNPKNMRERKAALKYKKVVEIE